MNEREREERTASELYQAQRLAEMYDIPAELKPPATQAGLTLEAATELHNKIIQYVDKNYPSIYRYRPIISRIFPDPVEHKYIMEWVFLIDNKKVVIYDDCTEFFNGNYYITNRESAFLEWCGLLHYCNKKWGTYPKMINELPPTSQRGLLCLYKQYEAEALDTEPRLKAPHLATAAELLDHLKKWDIPALIYLHPVKMQ